MSKQLNDTELARFAEQFAALWNESDAEVRRKQIRELWAPTATQTLVDPPVEMREQVENLQFALPALEVRGHDALERRVTRAFEMFIESGEYAFAVPAATRLPAGLVGVTWTMVTKADGSIAGGGFDVIGLDDEGRILTDHQFIEGVR
ncbi:hypothetical protein [Nocardia altamirensis]|uniref:hypothetical protein n=1 Tax=Nocardia altamirensis TaxID=472158 RepID=UPI00084086E6|nr:hypothetical protein [Nocardia altamirensis]